MSLPKHCSGYFFLFQGAFLRPKLNIRNAWVTVRGICWHCSAVKGHKPHYMETLILNQAEQYSSVLNTN